MTISNDLRKVASALLNREAWWLTPDGKEYRLNGEEHDPWLEKRYPEENDYTKWDQPYQGVSELFLRKHNWIRVAIMKNGEINLEIKEWTPRVKRLIEQFAARHHFPDTAKVVIDNLDGYTGFSGTLADVYDGDLKFR